MGAASSLLATLPSDATVPNVTDEVVVGLAHVAAALMKDPVPGQAATRPRGRPPSRACAGAKRADPVPALGDPRGVRAAAQRGGLRADRDAGLGP